MARDACLRLQLDHVHRGFLCSTITQRSRIRVFQNHKVPKRVTLRTSAAFQSVRTEDRRCHVSSNASLACNFQRSRTLHDYSTTSSDGMNDFERHLQELLAEVKTMIMKGKKEDVLLLLQANYESVKERLDAGTRGIEEAAFLDVIALGYVAVGDLQMVGTLLYKLHEVAIGLNEAEPLLDSVLLHMGSMYATLGMFENSMVVYSKALNILERSYGKNSTVLVIALLGIAKVLGFTGKATQAIEHYHRTITILEASRGFGSQDLVVPLFCLGNLLIKEGRAKEAEIPFSRILEIYANLYGETDGRTGMAMCSLAHAKCAKGEVDDAISLYRSALQVINESNFMALDDDIMEKMRIDLAELLHVVGRGVEGRRLLEECLLITEKHKGKQHPDSVTHLLNLATSYSRSKNFAEAEHVLRQCLQIMMKGVEPDDQAITFPMLHLAVVLYHLKQDREAEDLALRVLCIREKAFGRDSLPVGEALDCLVSIKMRMGKDDNELLDHLQRVLRIQEKEFGEECEEVMATQKKILFYLDKLGKKDDKFPIQRRLSMLRKKYKERVEY